MAIMKLSEDVMAIEPGKAITFERVAAFCFWAILAGIGVVIFATAPSAPSFIIAILLVGAGAFLVSAVKTKRMEFDRKNDTFKFETFTLFGKKSESWPLGRIALVEGRVQSVKGGQVVYAAFVFSDGTAICSNEMHLREMKNIRSIAQFIGAKFKVSDFWMDKAGGKMTSDEYISSIEE